MEAILTSFIMNSKNFFIATFNALPEQIYVINKAGDIQFVNQSWINFEKNNSTVQPTDYSKENYYNLCKNSSIFSKSEVSHVLSGIKAVANKEVEKFTFEYACHSDDIQRWFLLNSLPFTYKNNVYTVLQHINITKRKQADINSNIDALTGVGNRRAFDEFFENEWLRCARSSFPISIMIIDIDNFKAFNDTYGHVKGDWCLKTISNKLKQLAHRPSDIFCRYGGEEFVYVLGNTTAKQAEEVCQKVHLAIKALKITHKTTKISPYVTVSIGLACIHPENLAKKCTLIEYADKYLYDAKAQGKNTTKRHRCESEICTPENCSYFFK
jgi:diguanylate cyclase (GGDEF)-like protein